MKKYLLFGFATFFSILSFANDNLNGVYLLVSGENCPVEVKILFNQGVLETSYLDDQDSLQSLPLKLKLNQKERTRNFTSLPNLEEDAPYGRRHTVATNITQENKESGNVEINYQVKSQEKPGDCLMDRLKNKMDGEKYKTSYNSQVVRLNFDEADETLEYTFLEMFSNSLDKMPESLYNYIELDDESNLRKFKKLRVNKIKCLYQKH